MHGQPDSLGGGSPGQTGAPLGQLGHPCDLALVLFFHRHPRVLLTSERLAAFVGYDVKQIGRSLDLLMGAGVLQRSPNPTHEARLYAFEIGSDAGWLDGLLAAASSDAGYRALMQALKARPASEPRTDAVRGREPGGGTDAGPGCEEATHA